MSKELSKSETIEELRRQVAAQESLIKELGERVSKSQSGNEDTKKSEKAGGETLTEYRCRGKNCDFHTDDIGHLILHTVEEHTPKPKAEESEEAPKRRHETVEEYLNCPECFPKFEAAFLKRGYVKAPENKPEEPKKKGVFKFLEH